jgi:hypothetical protein
VQAARDAGIDGLEASRCASCSTIPPAPSSASRAATGATSRRGSCWALGVHAAIQTVEGYVLAPLIQNRAVDLPPVLTLASVLLFGALFGALGVALAAPLTAALRVAVARLYVEDRLGGG